MHDSTKYSDEKITFRNDKELSNSIKNFGKKKISRKQFFQRLGLLTLIPLAGAWYSTSQQTRLRDGQIKKIKIPSTVPQGISFFDSVIVSKNKNQVEIFSAKCTHLGCEINKTENGILVCPCHGSEYSSTGNVIKGPADKHLKKLPYKLNSKTGEITVEVMA